MCQAIPERTEGLLKAYTSILTVPPLLYTSILCQAIQSIQDAKRVTA